MNENSINQLIDSFVAYRDLLAPLQQSLVEVSKTYADIKEDLSALSKSLSGDPLGKLEKVHAALSAQAKSGQELNRRIEEYAQAGEKYSQAVNAMAEAFSGLTQKVEALEETENNARRQIERIDSLIEEKKSSYNLKDLQKSLDRYNVNIEKISDFINKDIATVMKQNADKIEAIRKENEELKAIVTRQNGDIAALADMFAQTTALLRTAVEGSAVNQQYIFEAFDKWAADRKVKIKRKQS